MSSRPSDQQIEQLAARAAAKLVEQDIEASDAKRAARKRPSRFRILLWVVELAAVLAVAEHFLIGRMFRTRPVTAKPLPVTVDHGPLAPELGAAALDLVGLTEVVPAYAASITGLADGSESARQAQLQTARDLKLPLEVQNSLGMRLRLIPSGTFAMGSPAKEIGRDATELQHVAVIEQPFYIGKFEVTQQQWEAVMGSNPAYFKGANRPVEEVTWDDCLVFMRKLCEREGVSVGTYRLPTEAQWEYACRAGTTTAYYFGNDPNRLVDYADYAWNNDKATSVVGGRRPNAYGLFNMHGNVWEWCLNRFYNYDGSTVEADRQLWRSLRGGQWHESADNCRSANRCRLPPDSSGNILGLRLVRTIPELQQPTTPVE